MASKKKNKAKRVPAVRYLRYELTNSGDAGTETSHYIDLARDLSAVNRRLMRQGRHYHVKRVTVVSSNTIAGVYPGASPGSKSQQNAGRLTIGTIPDSWSANSGWTRGFRLWNEMNKNAKNATNTISGTWSDFKVDLSRDSQIARAAGNLLEPLDNGGNAVQFGEWEYSAFVGPVSGGGTPDTYSIHMLGDHVGAAGAYTSVGLIQSFGDARSTVSSPSPDAPTTLDSDPLVNLFDYGDTVNTVIQALEYQNDDPPYDHFEYAGDGDNMPKPLVVQDAIISDGRCVLGGFTAMCGLLELETTSPIDDDVYSVLVELAPGKYRGIKAEAI